MKRYTVIAIDETSGAVIHWLTGMVDNPYAAIWQACEHWNKRKELDCILIVGAVPGQAQVSPPCDESGNACYASDYLGATA